MAPLAKAQLTSAYITPLRYFMQVMATNSNVRNPVSKGVGWRFTLPGFVRPQFKFFDPSPISSIVAFRFLKRTTSFAEVAREGFYTLVQKQAHFFVASDMVCFERRQNILFENFFHKKLTGVFSVDLRE